MTTSIFLAGDDQLVFVKAWDFFFLFAFVFGTFPPPWKTAVYLGVLGE